MTKRAGDRLSTAEGTVKRLTGCQERPVVGTKFIVLALSPELHEERPDSESEFVGTPTFG